MVPKVIPTIYERLWLFLKMGEGVYSKRSDSGERICQSSSCWVLCTAVDVVGAWETRQGSSMERYHLPSPVFCCPRTPQLVAGFLGCGRSQTEELARAFVCLPSDGTVTEEIITKAHVTLWLQAGFPFTVSSTSAFIIIVTRYGRSLDSITPSITVD